jgi:hypothetical protein
MPVPSFSGRTVLSVRDAAREIAGKRPSAAPRAAPAGLGCAAA